MNDFLDHARCLTLDPVESSTQEGWIGRVLDADLNIEWIGSAAAHLRRRGYTLGQAARQIRREHSYLWPDWWSIRSVLTGRIVWNELLAAIAALPNRKDAAP